MHAGPSHGGSCFPKDVTALIRTAREAKSPLALVEQVEKINMERKIAMAARIERAAGGSLRGKAIAVLGVTFKPDTDDMREAPSLVILPLLQARGAEIRICDPQGRETSELPIQPSRMRRRRDMKNGLRPVADQVQLSVEGGSPSSTSASVQLAKVKSGKQTTAQVRRWAVMSRLLENFVPSGARVRPQPPLWSQRFPHQR